MTSIRTQTERKRQERPARCAEKIAAEPEMAASRADPPSSKRFRDRRRRSGRKTLAQREGSGDRPVKRQATWGMSDKTEVAMRFKRWRIAAKGGIDGLVGIVIVVLSLILAAFQANLLLRLLPDNWMVSIFLALFLFDTAVLIWLWK